MVQDQDIKRAIAEIAARADELPSPPDLGPRVSHARRRHLILRAVAVPVTLLFIVALGYWALDAFRGDQMAGIDDSPAVALRGGTDTYSLGDQRLLVPSGQLLHEQRIDSEGVVLEERFIDPSERRMRVEKPLNDVISTVTVFDADGHTTLSGVTLEIYSASANYDEASASADVFVGMEMQKVGEESVDGRTVAVLEQSTGDLRFGPGAVLRSFVDESTGLRVRDEFRQGDDLVYVVTRELVDEIDNGKSLDRDSLGLEAESATAARNSELSEAAFPVFGLPDGYGGLRLFRVIPGPQWSSVRLEYKATTDANSSGGGVVIVTTVDVGSDPDYPQAFLAPIAEAAELPDDSGGVILFGREGMGVKVQVANSAAPLTAQEVANALVRVN